MTVALDRPWLSWDLGAPHRVLSWSLTRPGFACADRILWREVRNADLPRDFDVLGWFRSELDRRGAPDAVAMLTSRDIRAHHFATRVVDGVRADCLATVGLSNAEHVGSRLDRSGKDWGTINLALRVDAPLGDAALIEALSIAAEARTLAVLEARHQLPAGPASGTGTDCIAVAAPPGDQPFAGKHTPVGEAAGAAVLAAMRAGVTEWMRTVRHEGQV